MAEEYITRSDAIQKAKMANHDTNLGNVDLEQDERTESYINEIPRADVLPIVRCSDCQHGACYRESIICRKPTDKLDTYPRDFFCAYGEK